LITIQELVINRSNHNPTLYEQLKAIAPIINISIAPLYLGCPDILVLNALTISSIENEIIEDITKEIIPKFKKYGDNGMIAPITN